MSTRVITNKQTGMMETITVPDHDPKALADLHREVKDMIEGNTQFHDDPYTPAKPLLDVTTGNEEDQQDFWYNHIYP